MSVKLTIADAASLLAVLLGLLPRNVAVRNRLVRVRVRVLTAALLPLNFLLLDQSVLEIIYKIVSKRGK
jgi:hypothetical protein